MSVFTCSTLTKSRTISWLNFSKHKKINKLPFKMDPSFGIFKIKRKCSLDWNKYDLCTYTKWLLGGLITPVLVQNIDIVQSFIIKFFKNICI